MEDLAGIYYWIRFGVVLLFAAFGIGLALRRTRTRSPRSDLTLGIAGVIISVGGAILLGIPLDYLLAGSLTALGVAVGYAVGRVRPLVAWLLAATLVFAAIMLLFGAQGAVAFGVSVLAFGLALPIGQGLRAILARERTQARGVASEAE